MDMAVGIIIGASFGKIITSLVNDVLMPPIGLLLGKVDFSNLAVTLPFEVKIKYGVFLNTLIDFVIIAFVIFILIKQINKMSQKEKPKAVQPSTKECPYCFSAIQIKAKRCPHCTSTVE